MCFLDFGSTFNYVSEGNSDCDHINIDGKYDFNIISNWSEISGNTFFFYRKCISCKYQYGGSVHGAVEMLDLFRPPISTIRMVSNQNVVVSLAKALRYHPDTIQIFGTSCPNSTVYVRWTTFQMDWNYTGEILHGKFNAQVECA
jgi:hypothetical protein